MRRSTHLVPMPFVPTTPSSSDGIEDYLDDRLRRRCHRRVIHLLRADARAHARRHKSLRRRVDHPVFRGYEVPGRLYPPSRPRSLFLDAGNSERPLGRGKKRGPFGRCVLSESGGECLPRHPNEPVCVRRQLRRLRMRRLAIEDFCDRLAFIGCQGGDIDQRPNPLVRGSRRSPRRRRHAPRG